MYSNTYKATTPPAILRCHGARKGEICYKRGCAIFEERMAWRNAQLIAQEEAVSETGSATAAPEEFLKGVSSDLAAQSGCDLDLARILAEHILSATPQSDCVTRARRAIAELAQARAAPRPEAAPDA